MANCRDSLPIPARWELSSLRGCLHAVPIPRGVPSENEFVTPLNLLLKRVLPNSTGDSPSRGAAFVIFYYCGSLCLHGGHNNNSERKSQPALPSSSTFVQMNLEVSYAFFSY